MRQPLALRQSSEALGRERERLQRITGRLAGRGRDHDRQHCPPLPIHEWRKCSPSAWGPTCPTCTFFLDSENALLDQLGREGIVRDVGVQLRGPNGEICESLTTLMHMEYDGPAGGARLGSGL